MVKIINNISYLGMVLEFVKRYLFRGNSTKGFYIVMGGGTNNTF